MQYNGETGIFLVLAVEENQDWVSNEVTASRQCRRYSNQQCATQAHAGYPNPSSATQAMLDILNQQFSNFFCSWQSSLFQGTVAHWARTLATMEERWRLVHLRECFANIILNPYWACVSKISFKQQL
jgi:hypothetical protein